MPQPFRMALRRQVQPRRRTLVQHILADFWLAGVPVIAAMVIVLLQANRTSSLRVLATLLLASSITLLLKYAKASIESRQLAQLMVLLGFIGWYALPGLSSMWLAPGQFDEELPVMIHDNTVVLTFLYLALFQFSWLIASRFSRISSQSGTVDRTVPATDPSTLMIAALLACAIGLIPYLVSGLSISEIVTAVGEGRSTDKPWAYAEHLGNDTSPLLYLASSMKTAGAGLLLVVIQDRRVRSGPRLVSALIALTTAALVFFDQGTRSLTAIMLLPAALLLFIKTWGRSKRKATVVLLVGALILFIVLQFQLLFRSDYTRDRISGLILESWTTLGGTTDYFTETALAVELVPAYHDFFRESALVQFVVSPVPRFLWNNKPVAQVAWFYTLMRWGTNIYTDRGNTFPGIVGQYYMSWGWFGPIMLGIIFAFASTKCDRFLLRVSPFENPYSFAVGAMFAVWLLVSYRFLSPGFLYPVACAACIVAVSSLAFGKARRDAW